MRNLSTDHQGEFVAAALKKRGVSRPKRPSCESGEQREALDFSWAGFSIVGDASRRDSSGCWSDRSCAGYQTRSRVSTGDQSRREPGRFCVGISPERDYFRQLRRPVRRRTSLGGWRSPNAVPPRSATRALAHSQASVR